MLHNRFALYFLYFVLLFGSSGVFSITGAYASDEQPDYLNDQFYERDFETKGYAIDRLEPLNRAFFAFNDKFYFWILKPVATAYSNVVPTDLRICVYNFFRNLEEPMRFINALLQARFPDAGHIFVRFAVNSTLGVYGLGDAADRVFSYPPVEATLGQTLGKWGVGDGSYLVVPLYGPSTIRDFTGDMIDGLGLTPYYSWSDEFSVIAGTYIGKETNKISLHLGEYEDMKQLFFDPYVGFRNTYFQYRRQLRNYNPGENENTD